MIYVSLLGILLLLHGINLEHPDWALSVCQKRSQRAAFSDKIEAVMEMLKKETEQRQTIEMVCTDMLVPQEHLLRKIDAAIDFTHIYELVEDM